MLKEIIAANPNVTKQYQQRPERVEKMFIGLLMKQTKGQANPIKSINILRSLLKK
jgi:aspartyl-tRNA(Asn)/glutamyl-tRNA(Gln) amidotransferase subunit B